jgi:hypothetical protein
MLTSFGSPMAQDTTARTIVVMNSAHPLDHGVSKKRGPVDSPARQLGLGRRWLSLGGLAIAVVGLVIHVYTILLVGFIIVMATSTWTVFTSILTVTRVVRARYVQKKARDGALSKQHAGTNSDSQEA